MAPNNPVKKVSMRFLGNIEAKTDAKGRVFLPAAFRKELDISGGGRLVLRKDVFQQCLVLYPEEVWNGQIDTLRRRLNRWDAAHQQVFRQFVADAEAVTIDASGRILIPKRYLRMAAIERDIRFIGMDDTIEIWNAGTASQPFMELDEFSRAVEEAMREQD